MSHTPSLLIVHRGFPSILRNFHTSCAFQNNKETWNASSTTLMNGDPFKTPLNRGRIDGQSRVPPTTSAKRDSLAAELERGTSLFSLLSSLLFQLLSSHNSQLTKTAQTHNYQQQNVTTVPKSSLPPSPTPTSKDSSYHPKPRN